MDTAVSKKRKWFGNWNAINAIYPGTSRRRARLQNKPERREAKQEIVEQLKDDRTAMLRYYAAKIIDEDEFSQLVRDTYQRPYQLQQHGFDSGEPMRIGTYLEIDVPGTDTWLPGEHSLEEWLEREVENPGDKIAEIEWEREFTPDLQQLVNDLHAQGLLEAGEYLIKVEW